MVLVPFTVLVALLSSIFFVHSAPCFEAGLDRVNGYLLYRSGNSLKLYYQVSKGEKQACRHEINFPDADRLQNFQLHSFFYATNEFVVVIAEEKLANGKEKTYFTSFSGSGCLNFDDSNNLQMEGPISAMNAICTKDKKFGACRAEEGKRCSDDKDYYRNIRYVHGNCAYGPLRYLRYGPELKECADGMCILDTSNQKLTQRVVSKQCKKVVAIHGATTLCQNDDQLIAVTFNERVCVRKLGLSAEEGELVAYTLDLAAFSKGADALIANGNLNASCPPFDDVKLLFTHGIHYELVKPWNFSRTGGWCNEDIEPFVRYGSMFSAAISILLTISCCGGVIGVRVSTKMMMKDGKHMPGKPWEKRRGNDSMMTVGVTENQSAYGTVGTTVSEYSEATEVIRSTR